MSFRKILNIIGSAVIFVILAIFIAQNNQVVSIRFMKWNYDSQSGLLVLFSFLAGGLVALLICVISALFRKKSGKHEGVKPGKQDMEDLNVVMEKHETQTPERSEPEENKKE